MSRHHLLPPLAYVPQPTPKRIENRRRRIQVGDAGTFDDLDEAGETSEATAARRSTPAVNKPPPQNFPAIEGSESKPQHPKGRLSDGTLKAMLQAQELN
jgi:hypothetical protein